MSTSVMLLYTDVDESLVVSTRRVYRSYRVMIIVVKRLTLIAVQS